MNEKLIEKLKIAYPSGIVEDWDMDGMKNPERDNRIRKLLVTIRQEFPLAIAEEGRFPSDKAYNFAITEKDHPPFSTWIWNMGNPEKLAWIHANNGQPYLVLWLRISLVADYFDCYFNHWIPRGDTGYLDADFRREPNERWYEYLDGIKSLLNENGFEFVTVEIASEKTPYVSIRDYCSISDDDPRWADDDFEPPLVPASIHDCLFGEE